MMSGQAGYKRIQTIGRGSFGEVWLVQSHADKKQYVMKKIEMQFATPANRRAAEQEAKLLSRLHHPNLVAACDSFNDGEALHIVMTYCDGGDLYCRLQSQQGKLLSEPMIMEWFVQISMGLHYIHSKNILHRDLKTKNIFLTTHDLIKIGDLGIARNLGSTLDMAETLIGTPYYMSPELLSNQPYNHKSDVWALGVCVYEMAALKHAFTAGDMNTLVARIMEAKIGKIPDQYSSDLRNLMHAALRRDPDKRPSVEDILQHHYMKRTMHELVDHYSKGRSPRDEARSGLGGAPQRLGSDTADSGVWSMDASGHGGESPTRKSSSTSSMKSGYDRQGSGQSGNSRTGSSGAREGSGKSGNSRSGSGQSGSSRSGSGHLKVKTPDKSRSVSTTSTSSAGSQDDDTHQTAVLEKKTYARARRRRQLKDEPSTVLPDLEPDLTNSPRSPSPDAMATSKRDAFFMRREKANGRDPEKEAVSHRKEEIKDLLTSLSTSLNIKTSDYSVAKFRNEKRAAAEKRREHIKSQKSKQDKSVAKSLRPKDSEVDKTCTAGWDKIKLLRSECIGHIGEKSLTKAYDILTRTDPEKVASDLIKLLGHDTYMKHIQKIWQLKVMEEKMFEVVRT